MLNLRVDLHAIDATPARWRGDAGSSPLDRARTAASSPRNARDALVDFHTGVQLFGSDSLITIMAPGWIFYGVAAAAGPIVAYCVSQNRVYRGKSEAGAYNPFFYAAAGLSFGNFLLVATMGWLERRAVAAERA